MKELSFISILFCFAFSLSSQPQWSYDVTDKSHNILFPSELGDEFFENGDYIGVFFEEADGLYCAGYSVFITGENLVITAFGESFSFSGFSEGDYFRFIRFSNNIETEIYVNYNTIDFPNTASFAVDGLSGVISILENPILGCTDVSASNYNLTATVNDNSCISHEQLIIDSLNHVINELNSDLVECNSPLLINIQPGWNIIGYPLKDQQNLVEGFQEIVELIQIVKNNDGNIYMPEFNFNGIGSLIPGQGYQIKLTDGYSHFNFPSF